ncbi:hypothetical protein, partial [Pelagibius sp.]|uniref:hypothetical protein n=1 Tax=Pelagibius sp. TaxID=1931238 RepID=UPI002608A2E0
MVKIVLHIDIVLCVKFRLFSAFFVVRRTVREFHDALVTHADTLAAVVARVTGLGRNTGIFDLTDRDLGLARPLHLVGQQFARLILGDGR